MKFRLIKADSYIVTAVLIQSLLVLVQQLMISVFQIPEESTTVYRILMTAIPLSLAIIISFYRKWLMFISVYVIASMVLLYNVLVFPQNESFLQYDSLRFLLPVVIPSALCLMCVSRIETVEKVLYKISWIAVMLMLYYVWSLLSGKFVFIGYDMSLSYGLLLPTISLYSRKKWYSICAAFFLFIIIVVLGSRGAAFVFVLYLCYDIFQTNKQLIFPIIVIAGVCMLSLPLFLEWLEGYGLHSRTLELLLSNNINYSSGRDYLAEKISKVFWDSPITGIGLWGDRYILGTYCHNILLELYLNWGIIIATILLLFFFYKLLYVYVHSDINNKNMLVKYFMGMVLPLMFSGSYLISYDFGAFFGILVLINKDNLNESKD